MSPYHRNKIRTVLESIQRIQNWPDAIHLRLFRKSPGLRLLRFRDGLNVMVRGATRDWDVLHELIFAGSYGRAMDWIARAKGRESTVIDLGGNVGLFSLLASRQNPQGRIIAFEPGPPNIRLFRINMLLNNQVTGRVEVREQAVGGVSGTANWTFDELNPGGSSLYGTTGTAIPVQIAGFAEVMAQIPGEIELVKIDIEGAEYELLAHTPASTWRRVKAISLELHSDPAGKKTQEQFIGEMEALGYVVEEESVCSYFIYRA